MPSTRKKWRSPGNPVDVATSTTGEAGEPVGPDVVLRRYKDAIDTLRAAKHRAALGIKDPEMPLSLATNLWRQAKRDAADVLRVVGGGRMDSGGCVYHLHTEYDGDGRVSAYGVSIDRKLRKNRVAPFLVKAWRRYGVNE